MDLFATRSASPMLIGRQEEAFDNPEWIYELKMDGFRCLAYMDNTGVDFRNKRNMQMTSRFPASFVAFDCIYADDRKLLWEPLMQRKDVLQRLVTENDRIAVSRYIERQGIALYQAAEQRELEGIVAKRKDSAYLMGKRSRDWIKCKRMADEDFIVAGYIRKGKHTYSLILAKYRNGLLVYKGHVTSGVTSEAVSALTATGQNPFQLLPTGNQDAVWVMPDHVCTVEYMPNTRQALRQPVFKGNRQDICPDEVKIYK